MEFNTAVYGPAVTRILALDQNGNRLIPLVANPTSCSESAHAALAGCTAAALFPDASAPEAALAGLWLYFSCFDECHVIAQDLPTAVGSFWHAIVHRQEPDSGNSAYWFRRVGNHAVFPRLQEAAAEVKARYPRADFQPGPAWDPFGFILFCEQALRQPGSESMQAALEIQRAEWQLLFDHCARPQS